MICKYVFVLCVFISFNVCISLNVFCTLLTYYFCVHHDSVLIPTFPCGSNKESMFVCMCLSV